MLQMLGAWLLGIKSVPEVNEALASFVRPFSVSIISPEQ